MTIDEFKAKHVRKMQENWFTKLKGFLSIMATNRASKRHIYSIIRAPIDLIASFIPELSYSFVAIFRPGKPFIRYHRIVTDKKTGKLILFY
jgi:hypothetical protein